MDKTAFARAERINALRASYATYAPEYLQAGVKELGLKLIGDETREEVEFALAEATVDAEDAAVAREAEEKAAADRKAEREAFYQTKEGKKQRAVDEAAARDHAVRKVNTGFCAALPTAARMQGAYQPDPASNAGGDHPVPDGRYRVSGSQWVMSFEGGKWISADLAHARSEPDWIEIPDHDGAKVSAKSPPGEKY